MNRRALGCSVVAAAAFVAIGLAGLLMVIPQAGCPSRLQYGVRGYLPEGEPTERPQIPAPPGEPAPVQIGSTFVGLTTRAVYALPGDAPPAGSEELPALVALECGDGTYQTYRSAGST